MVFEGLSFGEKIKNSKHKPSGLTNSILLWQSANFPPQRCRLKSKWWKHSETLSLIFSYWQPQVDGEAEGFFVVGTPLDVLDVHDCKMVYHKRNWGWQQLRKCTQMRCCRIIVASCYLN